MTKTRLVGRRRECETLRTNCGFLGGAAGVPKEVPAMPRRRLIPLLAVAATAALASTQLAGASTKDMTFTDKASDNGSALDVTQVAVANDAAGNVTMRIPFPSAA